MVVVSAWLLTPVTDIPPTTDKLLVNEVLFVGGRRASFCFVKGGRVGDVKGGRDGSASKDTCASLETRV